MGRIKSKIKSYIRFLLHRMPIEKNKVVFINYDCKGFGDNLKYIAEEIKRQNMHCKMVWLVKGDFFVPDFVKKVNVYALKAYYELSTASVIISNCKNNIPPYFRKKKNQYYLQTWHGDFALKYIEKEVEDRLSTAYLRLSKADSGITDAVLSGNSQFTKILQESFWYPERCEILEFGVPRNDIYFKDRVFKNVLKQRLGFSLEDKILLYAPTFRDNLDFSSYNLDLERLRGFMCMISKENWKVVVRLHPNIASSIDQFCYSDTIINGTGFDDQQELCMISDCLITDYSSIMGDFLLMKKPVFLFASDLDRYSSQVTGRGLREMYYCLPCPLSHNQDELESQICGFDKVAYVESVNTFMLKYYCTFDDGHASERVVNHLKHYLGHD